MKRRPAKVNNKRRMSPEAKAKQKRERRLERESAPVVEIPNGEHPLRMRVENHGRKPVKLVTGEGQVVEGEHFTVVPQRDLPPSPYAT